MTGERLRIVGGAMQGQEIPLDNDFTVGRGEQGSGSLAGDTEISRQHARFRRLDSGQVMVEDLGSTNGTLVNGSRISGPYVLSPGDRVTVGKTTLELVGDEQATAVGTAGAAGVGDLGPLPAIGQPALAAAAPAGGPSAAAPARRPLILALAGLLLLGVGLAAGLLINKDDGKSSATAASAGAAPETSGGKGCVSDDTGRAGPGHFRFITSACENSDQSVARFPLKRGTSHGQTVWYVVTDSSKKADAKARGVNFAPKMANGAGTTGVQNVTMQGGVVNFPASVNFDHKQVVEAGPTGFPPKKAEPPAVGEAGYSPLIRLPNGTVLNAPQVANSTGRADKVISMDTAKGTVEYDETEGRYEDKVVHYASFESTSPIPAAIEDVTLAPALNALPRPGDFRLKTSARNQLVAFVNGPTGKDNTQRQGENSTVLDKLDPLNVLLEVPVLPKHDDIGDPHYSPMWDVHLAQWTKDGVAAGSRVRIQSTDEVDGRVTEKVVTGPGNAKFGASKIVVNCPLISVTAP